MSKNLPLLGIASWTLPWAIGVQGYPQPPKPLGWMGLLEKAVEADVSVLQIADNLPLHEMPVEELDQLRAAERSPVGRAVEYQGDLSLAEEFVQ